MRILGLVGVYRDSSVESFKREISMVNPGAVYKLDIRDSHKGVLLRERCLNDEPLLSDIDTS